MIKTETTAHENENWRTDINRMMKQLFTGVGPGRYRFVMAEGYKTLEGKAHVDLARREINLKGRLANEGATKTRLNKVCKLDVIEADPKLREIFTGIVKSLLIKHCA